MPTEILELNIGDQCLVEHQGSRHKGIIDHIYKNGTYRISLEDGTANLRNIQPWKVFGPKGEKTYEDESSSEEEEEEGDEEEEEEERKTSRPNKSASTKQKRNTKATITSEPAKKAKRPAIAPEQPHYCAVCLEDTSDTSNQLLCCKFCKLKVHKQCFFGSVKGPFRASNWACEVCLYQRPSGPETAVGGDDVQCVLCPQRDNNAMKITVDGRWVHITCALWVPGMSFGEPGRLDGITGEGQLAPSRGSRPCCLCRRTQQRGKGVACMFPKCKKRMHATCGLGGQRVLMAALDEDFLEEQHPLVARHAQVSDGQALVCFCEDHARAALEAEAGAPKEGARKRKRDLSHIPLPPALFSSDEEFEEEPSFQRTDDLGIRREFLKTSVGRSLAADGDSRASDLGEDSDGGRRSKNDLWAVRSADGKLFGGASGYFRVRLSKAVPADDKRARKQLKQQLPREDELERILQRLAPNHPDHLDRLSQVHRSQFASWWWQLLNGFSILLFGFGSKTSLLTEFAESVNTLHQQLLPHRLVLAGTDRFEAAATRIPNGKEKTRPGRRQSNSRQSSFVVEAPSVLVVHGHNPATSLHQIVATVTEQWLGVSETLKYPSLDSQCEFVVEVSKIGTHAKGDPMTAGQYLRKGSKRSWERSLKQVNDKWTFTGDGLFQTRDLVLVIHNVDGVALRAAECQNALSILSKSPRIRVIATVDHVHTPLLWNQQHLERFNWVWYDATTYQPYRRETKFLAPVVAGVNHEKARGTRYVLQSLTRNHIEVLALLARYQVGIQERHNGRTPGMEFSEFYGSLRDDMVVSNDRVLRQLLVELKDHELVAVRQYEGKEYVYICQSQEAIQEILDFSEHQR